MGTQAPIVSLSTLFHMWYIDLYCMWGISWGMSIAISTANCCFVLTTHYHTCIVWMIKWHYFSDYRQSICNVLSNVYLTNTNAWFCMNTLEPTSQPWLTWAPASISVFTTSRCSLKHAVISGLQWFCKTDIIRVYIKLISSWTTCMWNVQYG